MLPHLHVFQLKFCMHFSSLPCMLHAAVISSFFHLIMFGENYKLWNSSLCNLFQLPFTAESPYVSRLNRKCGRLDVSQPYVPPRPVTGIALYFLSINDEVTSKSEAFFCSTAVRTTNVTDGGVCEVHSKQVLLFVRKSETVPKCTQNPQAQNIHGTAIIRRTVNHPLGSSFKTQRAAFHACTCRCVAQKQIITSAPPCTEGCISLDFRIYRQASGKTTVLFLNFTETDVEIRG
jgi:ribosomal protein L34E